MNELEHWIAPFSFLLPGQLMSDADRSGIWEAVEAIGNQHELSYDKWIVLYKLIENFNVLPVKTQLALDKLVELVLDVKSKDAEIISCVIKNKGAHILTTVDRHPTILILDQVRSAVWCQESSDFIYVPWSQMVN